MNTQVNQELNGWTAKVKRAEFTSEVWDGDGEILASGLTQTQARVIARAPELEWKLQILVNALAHLADCALLIEER